MIVYTVDEEKKKMREEIERLRTQVVQLKAERGHKEISKEVNPTGMKTDDALHVHLFEISGMFIDGLW